MNWEAIGAIGEIVGALAVFFSLVYLASQIRVSNKTARNASHQELMDSILRIQSDVAASTEASDIFRRGLMNDETLTESELVRFRMILNQAVTVWERAYHLAKAGEIDSWLSGQFEFNRANVVRSPGFQSWFKTRKGLLSNEFQQVLESHMTDDDPFNPMWKRRN